MELFQQQQQQQERVTEWLMQQRGPMSPYVQPAAPTVAATPTTATATPTTSPTTLGTTVEPGTTGTIAPSAKPAPRPVKVTWPEAIGARPKVVYS
eukprot:3019032-Amphidinium_carterae.1